MSIVAAPRRRAPRRAITAVAAVLLASAAPSMPRVDQAAAAVEQEGLVMTRKWSPTVLPPNALDYLNAVQAVPEPATRVLYAVGTFDGFVGGYNLDTLEPLGAGVQLGGGVTAALPDGPTGAAFLGIRDSAGRVSLAAVAPRTNGLATLAVTDLAAQLPGRMIVGIYRPPGSNLLWLLSEVYATGVARAGGGVMVTELDVTDPTQPAIVSWSTALPDCLLAVHGSYTAAAMGYVAGALYFGCANPGTATTPGPPLPRGAARLAIAGSPSRGRTTPGTFRLFPRDGDFAAGYSTFDPGSGRLTMSALSAGVATTYVFDATTESYVGAISTGNNTVWQAGIDVITGRYYAATGNPDFGMLAADLRATPPSQGANFPQYAVVDGSSNASAPIGVDSVRHRLFVPYTPHSTATAKGMFFAVVEDRLPLYVPPSPADPDANTADVPEVPGRTAAAYAAAGQGYGSRLRQVGGSQTLEGNLTLVGGNFLSSSPVGRGTRELRTAHLNHISVLNTEAAASVISMDADEANTDRDLSAHVARPQQLPSTFSLPPGVDPFQPVAGWPVDDAFCLDFGSGASAGRATGAETTCDLAARTATVATSFSGGTVSDISTGASSLVASARVTAAKGSAFTVTAMAENVVVLGGRLRIDHVAATATAAAHGRKGTAKATWARTVSGVSVDGARVCEAQCEPRAVVDAVNAALGGKIVVDFPEPERVASPGGYQAVVRRSHAHQIQEIFLNGEPADRLETPALVVTVSQDGPKPARTRLELAAVQAEANYGISVIGAFTGDDAGGSDIAGLAALGSLGEAGQSPLFGLAPGAGGADDLIGLRRSSAPRRGSSRGLGGPLDLIWNGLQGSLPLLPIWGFLLIPIYLSARRWLLLQRGQLVSGGGT